MQPLKIIRLLYPCTHRGYVSLTPLPPGYFVIASWQELRSVFGKWVSQRQSCVLYFLSHPEVKARRPVGIGGGTVLGTDAGKQNQAADGNGCAAWNSVDFLG